MRQSLHRLVPGRSDLVDAAAVALLVTLALLGLRSCYGGSAWLACGLLGIVVGILAAHLVASLRLSVGWLVVATPLFAVLAGGPVLPDTALGGVLPTPGTASALVVGGLQGWADVLTVVPPVGSAYHLLALPYASGLLAASTGYWLARRLPWTWPALMPVTALAAGTILVGTLEPAFPRLMGVVLPCLALAWAAARRARRQGRSASVGGGAAPWRRIAAATGVLVLCGAVAAVAGASLPGVGDGTRVVLRDSTTPPFDPHRLPTPLGAFRRYVTVQEKERLFTVEGVPAGTRLRLATMDTYDGLVWSVAGGTGPSEGSSGWFEKVGRTIAAPPGETGREATMEVSVEGLDDLWLPDVGRVTQADFEGSRAADLADTFRYNRASGTAVVTGRLHRGDAYRLRVLLPSTPTWDELRRRPAAALDQPPAERVPEEVRGFAGETAENESDAAGQVIALQRALRAGFYSDGKAGQAESLPGHSAFRIAALLADPQAMVGDDEQYAAAMALALRELKIPSRVVVGFTVKNRAPSGPQVVLGSDAVAWVEVAMDGEGWVPIDPVPDENRRLDRQQSRPQPRPSQRSQPLPPPPVVAPAQEVQAGGQQRRGGSAPDSGDASWLGTALVVVAVASPLVLLLGVAGGIVALKLRRRRRRRRTGAPSARVAGGWSEVLDLAVDLGRAAPAATTRREAADALGGGAVAVLARRADAAVFDRGEPSEEEVDAYWDDVLAAEREWLAALPWWRRWWTRLTPNSLWRGRQGRRDGSGSRFRSHGWQRGWSRAWGLLPVPRRRTGQ